MVFYMKNLKYLFFAAFIFIFSIVYADNSFIFSTNPQSIAISQISGKINVQAKSPVAETTYLSPTSSSPTGKFLTGAGNPLARAYISTGDSNRAVYYKDSTAGDFVITIVVSNKNRVQIASINQHIYIGQPVFGAGLSASSTTTTEIVAPSGSSSVSLTKILGDISTKIFDISQKMSTLQSEIKRSGADIAGSLEPSVAERSAADVAVRSPSGLLDFATSPIRPAAEIAGALPTSPTKLPAMSITESQTATVFVAPSSPSLISRIFAWPISGFNFIRNLFIEK